MPKVLIAYALVYGPTREVAEEVGEVLTAREIETLIRPAEDFDSLEAMSAVILGGALCSFRPQECAAALVSTSQGARGSAACRVRDGAVQRCREGVRHSEQPPVQTPPQVPADLSGVCPGVWREARSGGTAVPAHCDEGAPAERPSGSRSDRRLGPVPARRVRIQQGVRLDLRERLHLGRQRTVSCPQWSLRVTRGTDRRSRQADLASARRTRHSMRALREFPSGRSTAQPIRWILSDCWYYGLRVLP